jgi:hypothetical protein
MMLILMDGGSGPDNNAPSQVPATAWREAIREIAKNASCDIKISFKNKYLK